MCTYASAVVLGVLAGLATGRAPFGMSEAATRQYSSNQNTSTVCGIIDTCYMFLLVRISQRRSSRKCQFVAPI